MGKASFPVPGSNPNANRRRRTGDSDALFYQFFLFISAESKIDSTGAAAYNHNCRRKGTMALRSAAAAAAEDLCRRHGATILPGVCVGRHAVVGACAVVTKDVPDYAVAVGNPARVVKMLDKKRFEKELKK